MHFNIKTLTIPVMIVFSFILMSWGYTGHRAISLNAALSLNQEMQDFNDWIPYIAEHCSDADYRKSDDPDEGVRHYIDIDNYAEFVSTGAISQSMNEVIAQHSSYFVYDNGILPWTTIQTYDSLRECMRRRDWEKSKYFAADLSHYVGDGHMPLHITKNYDGRLTGNDGIHSRYESTMINANVNKIIYSGERLEVIGNISQYVFDYIYADNKYVDSVLFADDYAKSFSTDIKSTLYKDALWEKTQYFTKVMFKNASHSLAELIYNAWLEAGKPSLTGTTITSEKKNQSEFSISPNPFKGSTSISLTLTSESDVLLQVRDMTGKTVAVIENNHLLPTTYTLNWEAQNLPAGIYMVELQTPNYRQVKKLILLN